MAKVFFAIAFHLCLQGAADEELKVAMPDGAAAKDTKSQLDATEHRPFYPSNNYNGYYYLGLFFLTIIKMF